MDQTRRGLMGLATGLAAVGWATETIAATAPALTEQPMVARVWHGRTPADKTDEYRQYLFEAGVKKIAILPGNRGVQMMVSNTADQGEFMVISYWNSIDAIKGYAGSDYTRQGLPDRQGKPRAALRPRREHVAELSLADVKTAVVRDRSQSPSRARLRLRRCLARLPQTSISHQIRRLFFVVSRNSHPQ